MLTQTVNHTCDNTFPITADPDAWQVTMCAASISGFIISIGMPVAKIVAIKKGIKFAGGLTIFAQLLIGLLTQKMTFADIGVYGPYVMDALFILTGIDSIMKNCIW